ncbi:MAG: glycine-rich domain-containing protein [Patescibacteria group bacterium]
MQIPSDGTYELLVVGGGGGGGSSFWGGGAGGAGGYANKTTVTLTAGQSYSVTV